MSRKSCKERDDKMGKEISIRITDTASYGNGSNDSRGRKRNRSLRIFKPEGIEHHGEHSAFTGTLPNGKKIISGTRDFKSGRCAILNPDDAREMHINRTAKMLADGSLSIADLETRSAGYRNK